MATNPTLLTMPLAQNGQKNTIPATQATAGDGLFSQSTGFPAETSLPLGAGGVAPSREDFNGLANLLGGVAYYAQKGWQFQFDAGQDYFAGCIVRDTTDGKLYECLNDVAAGGSVPSADSVNWKEFGVDVSSTLANTDLDNLTATGEDHFLEQDFTIIYPNGGTEANPANVTNNNTYIEANPFPGYDVECKVELYLGGEWGVAPLNGYSSNDIYGTGIFASQHNDESIKIIAGSSFLVATNPNRVRNLHPNTWSLADSQVYYTLPCRVKVWKVGKVASA